jgi:hypothetical protein
MPPPVVPAVATTITGTAPARDPRRSSRSARDPGAAAVGIDEAQGACVRCRPGARFSARRCGIRARYRTSAGPAKARAPSRRIRVGGGQRAEQRRVVRLGAAGGKMSGGAPRRGNPARRADRANHVALEFHRHGGGGGTRELRVEQARDAIGALRRKAGARVEQAEIARIGHLHDAVFHALDGPAQHLFERARPARSRRPQFSRKPPCRWSA